MIARPQSDEYGEFYAGYIKRVPEGSDLLALLAGQPTDLSALLARITDEQANVRPPAGEWSVKEVIGHVNDTERIFAYRALRITRGDTTPLPGFEQNDYVSNTNFNARSLADLLDEFEWQRRANVACFKPLSEAEIARRGIASNLGVSVHALLHIMAGHVLHHYESLKVDYHVQG